MIRWIKCTAALGAAVLLQLYGTAAYYAWQLPDSYYVQTGSRLEVDTALHIAAVPTAHTVQAAVTASSAADTTSLRLFGIIPIKDVEIQEIDTPMLVPCGEPFGIKLRMDGAMVVGMERIETASGQRCPAQEAGIWVRDSSAGIGTITFYEPESGSFGGLGHPICDADTGDILPFGSGEAAAVTISQVTKGVSGCAGMLQGSFSDDAPLGELLCNNRCGVFGTLYHNPSAEEAIPMALKQEIQTGAAQILCTVSGDTPKAYDITLEEIDYSGTDSTRNMTVCITDPELLEVTGGIVQGMSGSPILQNGKLVGAVTHVFVDDPTRGYGIFCENMVRYGLSGS